MQFNWGTGLASAGKGLADWANDAMTQKMKTDLEYQQALLSDQLLRSRSQDEYDRSHSPAALDFAEQSSLRTARGSATGSALAAAAPDVQAATAAAETNRIRATTLAGDLPDVKTAKADAAAFETAAQTRARLAEENTPEARQYAIDRAVAVATAETNARNRSEYSPANIAGAAARSEAIAEGSEKGRQKAVAAGIDTEAMDQAAELFLKYKIAPQGMGRSAAISQAWQTSLSRTAKRLGMSAEDINNAMQFNQTAQKTMNAFSAGGIIGRQVISQDSVIGHMDLIKTAALALQNHDNQLLNSIKNDWKAFWGSDVPTNFEGLAEIVAPEIVKAVIPGGGGVTDREDMKKLYSTKGAENQLVGLLDGQQKLIARQLLANEKEYTSKTNRKDFRDSLLPDTVKFLETVGAQDPSQKGGKAPPPTAVTGAGVPITGQPLPTGPHGEEIRMNSKGQFFYLDRVTKKLTEYKP